MTCADSEILIFKMILSPTHFVFPLNTSYIWYYISFFVGGPDHIYSVLKFIIPKDQLCRAEQARSRDLNFKMLRQEVKRPPTWSPRDHPDAYSSSV